MRFHGDIGNLCKSDKIPEYLLTNHCIHKYIYIYIYIIHIHMVQACITMELSQQEQGYSEITGNGRVHTMTISDYIKLALVIIHKYMYTDNFKERPVPRRRLG